jgi:hypothetical protein
MFSTRNLLGFPLDEKDGLLFKDYSTLVGYNSSVSVSFLWKLKKLFCVSLYFFLLFIFYIETNKYIIRKRRKRKIYKSISWPVVTIFRWGYTTKAKKNLHRTFTHPPNQPKQG